jgi:hypothetical protein
MLSDAISSNRCGSSLSAWLSFQDPLKSTPAGGANASFSLAQAASKITGNISTNMPRKSACRHRHLGVQLLGDNFQRMLCRLHMAVS